MPVCVDGSFAPPRRPLLPVNTKKRKMLGGLLHKFFPGLSHSDLPTVKLEERDDVQRVLISRETLECPVCYCVYTEIPVITPCGHTFCAKCMKRMSEMHSTTNAEHVFDCPYCRQKIPSKTRMVQNFLVETILRSVYIPNDDELPTENDLINAQKIQVARLTSQCDETMEKYNRLRARYHEDASKHRLHISVLYGTICTVLLSYFFGLLRFS